SSRTGIRASGTGPVRRFDGPALQRGHPPRPLLPALRQPQVPGHRPGRRAARTHPPGGGPRRRTVHAAHRRIRTRLHPRADQPARGHRRTPGGQVLPGPARPAHPFHRGLHRPRFLRTRHVGAVQCGHPADDAVARDEDRAAVLLPPLQPGRVSLRQRRDRLALPGPAGPHGLPLPSELPPDQHRAMTDPAVSPLDVDLARKRHVLAVAGDVTAEEVEALAVAKYPGAYWSEPDVLTLTEQVHLSGPFLLDGAARRGLGLPGGVAHAYLLTCPRERGGLVPPELAAVGGVLAAFADAALEGGEAHAVDVLVAMSRRLGALVRTSTGYLLEPEEWAGVDLRVYAPVWLYPDALVHVLHSTLPGIQVPDEPRTGPLPPGSPREASQLADRSGHDVVQLGDSERAWLHAEADAFDAHALAEPEVLESYGANWSYPS